MNQQADVNRGIEIALIAAVAENGVIGDGKGRDWYLPGDLKRFKALTVRKPVIMGSVTWKIIGHALPDRPNIVLSHDPAFRAPGAHVVHSLNEAYDLARSLAGPLEAREIMIIGGGQVYAEALKDSKRIYKTEVKASPAGKVRFPKLDMTEWQEVERPKVTPDPKDSCAYSYITLRRRHQSS